MSCCAACGCTAAHAAHAVASRLWDDDLDGALAAGLLTAEPCPECSTACCASLVRARAERHEALAARERYRRREARIAERKAARAAPVRTLPSAAADVLARALQRARGTA